MPPDGVPTLGLLALGHRLVGNQPKDHSEIAAIFAICDCHARRGPQKSLAISGTRQSNAALRLKGAMESR